MRRLCTKLFVGAAACLFVSNISSAKAGTETVLYSFCSQTNCADGDGPNAGLINVKGTLYGTTEYGGAYGGGTIFALDPTSGAETVLYSFCSQANCADGTAPKANLIHVGGKLYGETLSGGNNGYGTVFSLTLKTGTEKVLHSFCSQANCADGATPYAGLLNVNGTLYGTAANGGSLCMTNCGVVFALDRTTGQETVLHSFGNAPDGAEPFGQLLDVSGTLYGTTAMGGASGLGTLFSLDLATNAEQVLHSFAGGLDGISPATQPIDVGGILYGTTNFGGGNSCFDFNGCGTVYSFDPATGVETVLYRFCGQANCGDGWLSVASLINVKGKLYSTTLGGGTGNCTYYGIPGCGTVFAFDLKTGRESVTYPFCSLAGCVDGDQPPNDLINVNGTLYSVAYAGGANGAGVVFAFSP